MQVVVLTYVLVSLGCIPRSGITLSNGNSMFKCLRTTKSFSTLAVLVYIPTSTM